MKPVGKYAANVVNLAARRMLMQQLQASKDKLDGKETAEETAARDERQRQRLFILDKLREAMAKAYAVLGDIDGAFAIELAHDDVRKQAKFEEAREF